MGGISVIQRGRALSMHRTPRERRANTVRTPCDHHANTARTPPPSNISSVAQSPLLVRNTNSRLIVRACVRACVRASVRACVRACMRAGLTIVRVVRSNKTPKMS